MGDSDALSVGPAVGPGGRYVLVRQVGSGATGTVHEARDAVLGRRVAVKLIDLRLAGDPVLHRRVVVEAEVLARLDSRSIVRVYDFGQTDEGTYLVTEYLPDGDLGAWVSQHGPLSPRDAALVVADVCDALGQAHAAGIIHRDVKPGNVLVRARDGVIEGYLADFGIARPDDSDLTVTGQVLGTARYMSPEQHEGARASAAGDVYSAGCVLWFALTGRPPYDGTLHQQAVGHVEAPVPQLGRPELGWADAILARSMAKDPAARYDGAPEMAAALRAAATRAGDTVTEVVADAPRSSDTVTSPTGSAAPPSRRPGGRRALVLVAAGAVLAATAAGAGWAVSRAGDRGGTGAQQWRCGDGSVADAASACVTPSGVSGLAAVFPVSRGCTVNTHDVAKVYAVSCDFERSRGFSITFSAWPSHRVALDHYRALADAAGAGAPTTWVVRGEEAGLAWHLDRPRPRASFLYDDVDYSVSVSGETRADLEAAVAYVERQAMPPSSLVPQRIG